MLKITLRFFLLLWFITGVLYPLLVTVVAQWCFPYQANGSLLYSNDKVIGSRLIGQYFEQDKFFWGRPSATQPVPYNASASTGSNLGPLNEKLFMAVSERVAKLKKQKHEEGDLVPVDLVTASGSGLDPHISPLAANYQATRVAKARGIPTEQLQELIRQYTQRKTLWMLGEPRVNVLELNLALEQLHVNKN